MALIDKHMVRAQCIIMPLTLEKLKGCIAFPLSVHASVRGSVAKFIKIQF